MISVEIHDEGSKIEVATRKGAKTGDDTINGGRKSEQWVRKSIGPMSKFDPQQEK